MSRRFFAGCSASSATATWPGSGRRCSSTRTCPLLPGRATSRRWCTPRWPSPRRRTGSRAFACTSSIGPGATNMITGAAVATVNRLPVLLLPGDVFADAHAAPVLQQLESPHEPGCLGQRLLQARLALLGPHQPPGAARGRRAGGDARADRPGRDRRRHAALPQDVQTRRTTYPARSETRVWRVPHGRRNARRCAARLSRAGGEAAADRRRRRRDLHARRPRRSRTFAERPASRSARRRPARARCRSDHPSSLGAIGATGRRPPTGCAREADLVIGVGTRLSDFTTASNPAFQHPDVRFVELNVAALRRRQAERPGRSQADARLALEELQDVAGRPPRGRGVVAARGRASHAAWDGEVDRLVTAQHEPLPSQAEVIGAVNDAAGDTGVVVCAAGSHARRPAQALASARSEGLPPRVRLLVHGLRDRRRAWASSWPRPSARCS